MIVINTKINVHDSKNLTKQIQGYLYSFLPKKNMKDISTKRQRKTSRRLTLITN